MPSSSDSPALIRRALVSEGRHPSVQRSESGNDGGDASFPSTVANSFLVYACSIWDLCASSDVTSQVALDDFVGFLHERAPSSWPHNGVQTNAARFLATNSSIVIGGRPRICAASEFVPAKTPSCASTVVARQCSLKRALPVWPIDSAKVSTLAC